MSSAFKESSNCTTFGVIRSIYFIKLNTVHESLNVELNIENYYCWVDSQIVLAWIKTPLVNSLKRCGKSLKFYSKEGRPRELVLLPDR